MAFPAGAGKENSVGRNGFPGARAAPAGGALSAILLSQALSPRPPPQHGPASIAALAEPASVNSTAGNRASGARILAPESATTFVCVEKFTLPYLTYGVLLVSCLFSRPCTYGAPFAL